MDKMTRCRFCGSTIPDLPEIPDEMRTTYCPVRRAKQGILTRCQYPVDGRYQHCNWPGAVCPVAWAFSSEKDRKAMCKWRFRSKAA